MIAPTLISNFDEIVKKMIFKSEGKNITVVKQKKGEGFPSPYETPPP
jgi:hypothetical protein